MPPSHPLGGVLWTRVERLNHIAMYIGTHIVAIGYGFHAIIVLFVIIYFILSKSRHHRDKRRAGLMLLFLTFASGTVHHMCTVTLGNAAWTMHMRSYPEFRGMILTSRQHWHLGRAVMTAKGGKVTAATILGGGLLLYRASVSWDRKWYIVLPLGLLYTTTTALLMFCVAQPHMKGALRIIDLGVTTQTSLMATNFAIQSMLNLRLVIYLLKIGLD